MWRRTVTGAIASRCAMSAVLCRRRSMPSTWASRGVSSVGAGAAPAKLEEQLEHQRAGDHRLLVGDRTHDPPQPLGVERAGDVADGTGPDRVEHPVGVADLGEEHDRGAGRGPGDAAHRGQGVAVHALSDQAQIGLLALGRADGMFGVLGLGADLHLTVSIEGQADPHPHRRPVGEEKPERTLHRRLGSGFR